MTRPKQRLVLRVNGNRSINVGDFMLYADRIRELEIPHDGEIEVVVEDDGTRYFYAPLPPRKGRSSEPDENANERAIRRAKERRQERIENGEQVPGYEPPVVPPRVVKIRKSAIRRIMNGEDE